MVCFFLLYSALNVSMKLEIFVILLTLNFTSQVKEIESIFFFRFFFFAFLLLFFLEIGENGTTEMNKTIYEACEPQALAAHPTNADLLEGNSMHWLTKQFHARFFTFCWWMYPAKAQNHLHISDDFRIMLVCLLTNKISFANTQTNMIF